MSAQQRFDANQVMIAEGFPFDKACLLLGVSVSSYNRWLNRPLSG